MQTPENQPAPDSNDPPKPPESPQQVRVNRTTARVPENIGRGVFSTGAIVMTGPNEFLIDFVQRMGRPHHVVARVVIPFGVLPQLIQALEANVSKYESQFGPAKELPKPAAPPAQRPSIDEIYEGLKLPDEMLSGSYANAVLISHSAAEFSFDFVTSFFPHSAVSNRVYLSAPHVKPLLDSLRTNFKQLQQRMSKQQGQSEGEKEPPSSDETGN